jgi:hypothetical protein
MRQIARKLLLTFLLTLVWTVSASAATVNLSGSPPLEVNQTALENEYHRLVNQLADNRIRMDRPIHIIYYGPNDERPPAAAALPEWGGGGALGQDTILIPLGRPSFFNRNLHQVTVHEMAHLVIARSYPGTDIPRWFHEGCAMTLSGEVSFDEAVSLARAVLLNRLIPFDAIDSVNEFNRARAELAYGQSHAAILFFIDNFDMEGIRELLGRARRSGSFEEGMHATLGFVPREFERLAMQHIRRHYGLAFIFGDLYIIWLLVLLLAGATFVVTRIRNHRRLRTLEQQEPRQEPHTDHQQENSHDTTADYDPPPPS